MKKNKPVCRWATAVIELANRSFGLSTDAFLKSVKKLLDKEVRTIPFNHLTAARVPYQEPLLVMFYFTMLGSQSIYIFGIDYQTTLQVQEKLISRLPVEIYVQLRCYCCGRILGNIGALQKY